MDFFSPVWHTRMGDALASGVELGVAHGLLPFISPPAYVERAPQTMVNYLDTDWWALFRRLECDLGDPQNDFCRDGKLFRKRFRLPFSDFYDIYETVRDEEWFGEEKQSKRIPPLPLKMMGTFRLLGRNLVYDDITEISKINSETMRCFFRGFTHAFSRRFYDQWMKQPQTDADIFENERVYRANGLSGCCNSFDGFHVVWDRCPAAWNSEFYGKEGCPTIMYQIVVNHATWINSVTPGFPGSINDKTGVRYDAYIQRLRSDPLFLNYEYPLYDSQGRTIRGKGAWAIVDGGYHRWRVSQGPAPDAPTMQERSLSKVIVENRKDSEDTIGRVRGRFRILRMPFLCKQREDIDAVVHTSAIVHNMLLQKDGYASKFDDVDPEFYANDVDQDDDAEVGWRPVQNDGRVVGPMDDYLGEGLQLQRTVGAETEPGYTSFREKLVQHAHYMHHNGLLQHNH